VFSCATPLRTQLHMQLRMRMLAIAELVRMRIRELTTAIT
jgi:hypothetical protein